MSTYAIMPNHYHLVLPIDEKQAKTWTQQDIVTRWATLHHTPNQIELAKHQRICEAKIDKLDFEHTS